MSNIDVYIHRKNSSADPVEPETNPTNPDNPSQNPSGGGEPTNNQDNSHSTPAETNNNDGTNKENNIAPTPASTTSGDTTVAIVPNTGHVSNGNELIIGGSFSIAIFALLIFSYLFLKHRKQHKEKTAFLRPVGKKATGLSPVLLLPAVSLVSLIVALSSMTSFAAVNELELPVRASKYVDLDVSMEDKDTIFWVKDTIKIPASSSGYSVYLSASSRFLRNEDNSGAIISIEEEGELERNSFGYSLEEPTGTSGFLPLPEENEPVLIYSSESGEEAKEIPIYYAARISTILEGHYTTKINYTVTTNRDLIMQDMSPETCSLLTPGISYIFTDIRNNKDYKVEKLADGNCWMTESLALELVAPTEEEAEAGQTGGTKRINVSTGEEEIIQLDNTNTDVSGVFVPNRNTETETGEEWNCWSEEGCAEKGLRSFKYVEEIGSEESEESEETEGEAEEAVSQTIDHYFYTWYTATAGSGTYNTERDTSVNDSLCPKGWHLPVREEQNVLFDQETKDKLISVFSPTLSYGSGRIEKEDSYFWSATTRGGGEPYLIRHEFDSDEKDMRSWINVSDNSAYRGGAIRCVANVDAIYINYDDNTEDRVANFPEPVIITEKENGVFSVHIPEEIPTRKGYVFSGYSTRPNGFVQYSAGDDIVVTSSVFNLYAIWHKSVNEDLDSPSTFQGFTEEMCENLEVGVDYSLTDARDGKTYSIARMEDGNCWMTQNLDLDLDPEVPLTSEDTDLPEGTEWRARAKTYTRADEEALKNKDSSEGSSEGYAVTYGDDYEEEDDDGLVWDYTLAGEGGEMESEMDLCIFDEENYCSDRSYSYDIGNHGDGNLYNLFAASAGSAGLSANSETSEFELLNVSETASICPKGWSMATTDNYTNLAKAYGLVPGGYEFDEEDEASTNYYLNRIPHFTNSFTGAYSQMEIISKRNGYLKGLWDGGEEGPFSLYQSPNGSTIVAGEDEEGWFAFGDTKEADFDLDAPAEVYSIAGGSVRCVMSFSQATLTYDDNTEEDIVVPAPETKNPDASHMVSFTISSEVPEREGYIFAGWSKTQERDGALYFSGDNITLSSPNLTLYATWLKEVKNGNDAINNLQDLNYDVCNQLEFNEAYGMYDKRDGKLYSIARMNDGKCWMTQNLALGGNEETELNAETTNLMEGETFMLPASTSGHNSWNGDGCWDDSSITGNCHEPRMHQEKNSGVYGNYYNWTAAVAMDNSSSLTENGDIATTSICPKGWRLPVGGEEYDMNEYAILVGAYDGIRDASEWRRVDQNILPSPFFTTFAGEYEYGRKGSRSMLWTATARGRTYSGYFIYDGNEVGFSSGTNYEGISVRCLLSFEHIAVSYDKNTEDEVEDLPVEPEPVETDKYTAEFTLSENTPRREGYIFVGWSKTRNRDGVVYQPGESVASYSPDLTLYAIWYKELKVDDELITMQTLTQDICENNMGMEETYGLRDERDNKVYTVARLRDGKCWMTQNLALGGEEEMVLTSDDTNLEEGTTFTLPASSSNLEKWNDYSDAYRTPYMYIDKESDIYGNYYNWSSAVANQENYISGYTNASFSICPKGWRLPYAKKSISYNDKDMRLDKNEFGVLFKQYGLDTDERTLSSSIIENRPLTFLLAGDIVYNGRVESKKYRTSYWTSTTNGDTRAYYVGIEKWTNEQYSMDFSNERRYTGRSVRCVLDYSKITYSYNSNTSDEVENMPDTVGEIDLNSEDKTIVISNETPIRDSYIFAGWSLTPERDDALYYPGDIAELEPVSPEITFYATWLSELSVNNERIDLQTLTPEICRENMEIEKTYGLQDIRDGKVYTVAKLKDDRCWMTQNLALGGDESISLTSDNTNLEEGQVYYLRASTQASSNWGGSSSYPSAALRTATIGGTSIYGNYYSYPAAIAQYSVREIKGTNSVTSICPRGWRLPVTDYMRDIEPSDNLFEYSEYYRLFDKYSKSNDGDYRFEKSKVPFSFTFAGSIANKSSVNYAMGNVGEYWTSTSAGGQYQKAYSLYVGNGGDSIYIYKNTMADKSSGASIRCVLSFDSVGYSFDKNTNDPVGNLLIGKINMDVDPLFPEFVFPAETPMRTGYLFAGWSLSPERNGLLFYPGEIFKLWTNQYTFYATWLEELRVGNQIINMQSLTPEICKNKMEVDRTYGLEDIRDGKVYTIAKLKDGRCWMTQNLALGGNSEVLLTNDLSDVTESYTLPKQTKLGKAEDGAGIYGNFYYRDEVNASGNGSLCPKGWKLPVTDNFITMLESYNISHDNYSGINNYEFVFNEPISLVRTGGFGEIGAFKMDSDSNALWAQSSLFYAAAYGLYTSYSNYSNPIISARCILDVATTFEFDENAEDEIDKEAISTLSIEQSGTYNYGAESAGETEGDEESEKETKKNEPKDEKSEPLGVVKKTATKQTENSAVLIIIISSLLILLGVITIFVIEKRRREEE